MTTKRVKNQCCPTDEECCPASPTADERPPLTYMQAVKMTALFKVLANDTRLRLLHHLVRLGEVCVTDLAAALGMKPQAVSNQLQRLADTNIVAARREGNNIYYRVVDRCIPPLLDYALCIMEDDRPGSSRG
jgi:DNA-binding transcriptional ArsR family regulator